MRVFYDHQIFCEQSFGGISRYYYELIKGAYEMGLYEPILEVAYSDNVFTQLLKADNRWLTGARFKGRKDLVRIINLVHTYFKVRNTTFDIFHPTYFHDSALKNRMGKPMFITVLDMIDEKYHQNQQKFRKLIRHRERMINAADHILAISENTRKDIIAHFNVDTSKVTTIHLASSLESTVIESISKDPNVKPNILFIGSRKGIHKNFNNYIAAISLIAKKNLSHEFIFGGGGDFTPEEMKLIEKYGLTDRIKYMPIKKDEDIIRLYKNASLLIYPSLYEGFGLPRVESFSCGTPCATASGSCLEEVGGDAASYFNPLDPDDIAHVSLSLLNDPKRAAVQIEKGLERSKLFSWSQTVKKTHDVYRKYL